MIARRPVTRCSKSVDAAQIASMVAIGKEQAAFVRRPRSLR
jgi:hypothetical protein